jgi:uncharacterized membrane protein
VSRRAEAATPPRAALLLAALLAGAGLVLSAVLVRLHQQAHAGASSFCSISETVNCDRVATSSWSVFLGLPVAAWGVLGYAAVLAVAAWGLRARRPHPGWPAGLILVAGALFTAVSAGLALVSKLGVGAWCLLCAGSWATSAGLLLAGLWASRGAGPAAALRADLAALRAAPGRFAAFGLAAVAAAGVAAASWPRYWERPPRPPAPAGGQVAGPFSGPVVEYSDYECPFCALAHRELKAQLARRPDVQVVRRHFPLDPSCNPGVKRAIHPAACQLARAGICAEEQGRFAEMDDALFGNQQERRPLEELAARVGLDLPRFRACLDARSTATRLAADVAAGLAAGVPATPAYVLGTTVRAGQFPWELLPPRSP